jgi:hypothetical protein
VGASWHIWHAADAPTLKKFLMEELGEEMGLHDPLHDQCVYVTKELRQKLMEYVEGEYLLRQKTTEHIHP